MNEREQRSGAKVDYKTLHNTGKVETLGVESVSAGLQIKNDAENESLVESENDDDFDTDLVLLKSLREEKARLEQANKKALVKKEIVLLQQEVSQLKKSADSADKHSKSKAASVGIPGKEKKHRTRVKGEDYYSGGQAQVTIETLRKQVNLQKEADRTMNLLGLVSDESSPSSDSSSNSESNTSSSSSGSSEESCHSKSKKKNSKKSSFKSGIRARASDKVKDPKIWPHISLQFEFVNNKLEFKDLEYRLFVAGELEIITRPHIHKSERNGRLAMLKKISYLNGLYEWKVCLDLYAAWLRSIELGLRSWGNNDTRELEARP